MVEYSWKGYTAAEGPVEGSIPVSHLHDVDGLVKEKQDDLVDAYEKDSGWFFINCKGTDFPAEMKASTRVIRGILDDIEEKGMDYKFIKIVDSDGHQIDVDALPVKYVEKLSGILSKFKLAHIGNDREDAETVNPDRVISLKYAPAIIGIIGAIIAFIPLFPSDTTAFWDVTLSDFYGSSTSYVTSWGDFVIPGYSQTLLGPQWMIPGFLLLAGIILMVIGSIVANNGGSKSCLIIGALLPIASAVVFACVMGAEFSKEFIIPGFSMNFFYASGYSEYIGLNVTWGMGTGWYLCFGATAAGIVASLPILYQKS